MKMIHRPRVASISTSEKPVLLMNIGVGWSATTPFAYTLAIQQKYCHTGHLKENSYLRMLYEQDILNERDAIEHAITDPEKWVYHKWQKELYEYSYHFLDDDYLHKWYGEPLTIEKYIDYYLRHWNRIRGDFKAVADFSNHNWAIPFYQKGKWAKPVIERIREVFDVKVTVEFRDPIRRLYSEIGTNFFDHTSPQINSEAADLKRREGASLIEEGKHNEFFRLCFLYGVEGSANCRYVELYKKWEELVGKDNILPIIMEDFWNPEKKQQQCERLSNFLDYPITDIHRNAYVPDMGSNAPQYIGLIDQWTSDKEDITNFSIKYALNYMRVYYNEWKHKFGSVPESWINYEG